MLCADGTRPPCSTHALVFMVAGLSTRWKQTVAYEFTGNSYSASEADERIKLIIIKCFEIGIKIDAIISDMGPQNQALGKSRCY